MVILSVCPSAVQYDPVPFQNAVEIENSGFHFMIA